jgi:hypothetical protein
MLRHVGLWLLLLLGIKVLLLPRRCCTCLHLLRMLLMVSCTPAYSAAVE